jgi:hypothetical protein
MLGGFVVSATGVYLALRRVRSELGTLFRILVTPRAVRNIPWPWQRGASSWEPQPMLAAE